MGRRALLNLVLAVMVIALVLVVWFEPGLEREDAPARLTGLAAGDVDRIGIRIAGGEDIEIMRAAGQWRITAPVDAEANEFRIEPLLRVVEARSYAHFEAEAGELARYGLAPPRALLRVNGVEIAFGDSEPIDHRRYARVGGVVHLIDDHYLPRLQAGLPAFVSNRLLPEGARPVAFVFPNLAVTQSADGRWQVEPERGLSMDAVNRFVDGWAHARAIFVDRHAGEPSQGEITVMLRGAEQPLTFLILETEADVVLAPAGTGLVYHLGSEQGARLLDPDLAAAGDGFGEED